MDMGRGKERGGEDEMSERVTGKLTLPYVK